MDTPSQTEAEGSPLPGKVTIGTGRSRLNQLVSKVGLIVVGLLLLAAAAYGGYYFEHTRAVATEAGLQKQIDSLKNQASSAASPSTHTTINSSDQPCTGSSGLRVAQAAMQGAAGTTGITYAFTNTGTKACTLTGSPVVSLRERDALLGTATASSVSDSTITLQPSKKAYATVLFPNPGNFQAGECSATEATDILFLLDGPTNYSDGVGTNISGQRYCPGFAVQPFTTTAP